MTRASRRDVAVVAAVDRALPKLRRQFARQRAQAQRAWRNYLITTDGAGPTAAEAHRAWSDAIDEALRTIEAISAEHAHDVDDLLTQFDAIWWWIRMDDNVLDRSTRRWLARFGRQLRRLVRHGG